MVFLLSRLIVALTLLFMLPVGLAFAIGSTISTQVISFVVIQRVVQPEWHKHLRLIDIQLGLTVKIPTQAIYIDNLGIWSPDGKQITYNDMFGRSFVWDINSNAKYKLTRSHSSALIVGWSQVSNSILMHIFQNNLNKLFLVQPDGDNLIWPRIPRGAFLISQDASFSPDGRFIVFSGLNQEEGDSEIYRFDINEEKLTQLTDGSENHSFEVNLSPDGQQIAYLTSSSTGYVDIFVMNVDGSNQRQVTASVGTQANPQWSPDGTQLLFRSAIDMNFPNVLDVINADGTERRRLVDHASRYGAFSWSPDGKYILYEVNRHDEGIDLYMMPSAGGEPRLLYSERFDWVQDSSWQPQP
jgi:TolB protein